MTKRMSAIAIAAALFSATTATQAHAEASSWQCVTFARFFSGIQIFGDAWTWWQGAAGKYARGYSPSTGSVLVFRAQGPMARGHVAVVSQVLTDRIIQITHANWSPINGSRGQVEKDVTVVDVSQRGDWSQVKVWYDPTGDLGGRIYPTYGFIYRAADRVANAAVQVASVLTAPKPAQPAPVQVATASQVGSVASAH